MLCPSLFALALLKEHCSPIAGEAMQWQLPMASWIGLLLAESVFS